MVWIFALVALAVILFIFAFIGRRKSINRETAVTSDGQQVSVDRFVKAMALSVSVIYCILALTPWVSLRDGNPDGGELALPVVATAFAVATGLLAKYRNAAMSRRFSMIGGDRGREAVGEYSQAISSNAWIYYLVLIPAVVSFIYALQAY